MPLTRRPHCIRTPTSPRAAGRGEEVTPPNRARAWSRPSTALVSSGSRPPSPISTSSAAAVVPPGEVTLRSQCRRIELGAMQQLAGARNRRPRELLRQRARQAGGLARMRRASRPAGRHRPAPSPTPPSPRPSAPRRPPIRPLRSRREACGRARAARRVTRAFGQRDGDAAADGGRRVRHGAHDRGLRQCPFEETDRPARHDRNHQGLRRRRSGTRPGRTSGAACGLIASTITAALPRSWPPD